MDKVYYFGCDDEIGHYMFLPGMKTDWQFCRTNPWGFNIDGLCGGSGDWLILQKDGWTVITKSDYSVDTRPGSNCAFLAEGDFSKEQMKELALKYFPAKAQQVGLRGKV